MSERIRLKAACPGCGFVRYVTAYARNGVPEDWCHPDKRLCGLCEAYARAAHYRAEARRFLHKADELRARRARAQERKAKP